MLQKATGIAIADMGIIPLFFLDNTWAMKAGINYEGRSDGYTLPYYVTAE